MNDRATIFWHTKRMPESDRFTPLQPNQAPYRFHLMAIESDFHRAPDAQGLGQHDTVHLDFSRVCMPKGHKILVGIIGEYR